MIIIQILLVMGIVFCISSSYANDNLIKAEALANKSLSPINFIGPGNDFAGGIIWLTNKKLETPVEINDDISCTSQVRGFYFNSQRGERLWPLDKDTLEDFKNSNNNQANGYTGLLLDGGRYTDCYSLNDSDVKNYVEYGIFGSIQHIYRGNEYYLLAGVDMDYWSNQLKGSGNTSFSPSRTHSFQYINNKTPAGYVYDTVGGIGFVGGRLGSDSSVIDTDIRGQHKELLEELGGRQDGVRNINKAFSQSADGTLTIFGNLGVKGYEAKAAQNTRLGFAVLGTVGVGQGYADITKRAILGNPGETSSISEIASINASDRFNQARKNAYKLCRDGSKQIICKSGDVYLFLSENNIGDTLDDTNRTSIENKSLYIKSGNLHLVGSHTANSQPLDIFVDGGVVIHTNKAPVGINASGYPVSSQASTITQGYVYKMNLIVNGIIQNSADNTKDRRIFIHGKLAALNHIAKAAEKRAGWLGTGDTYANVFTRRCNAMTGKGSDEADCSNDTDSYADVPLVIIDRNIPSRFLAR